jgi:hypothetical protein
MLSDGTAAVRRKTAEKLSRQTTPQVNQPPSGRGIMKRPLSAPDLTSREMVSETLAMRPPPLLQLRGSRDNLSTCNESASDPTRESTPVTSPQSCRKPCFSPPSLKQSPFSVASRRVVGLTPAPPPQPSLQNVESDENMGSAASSGELDAVVVDGDESLGEEFEELFEEDDEFHDDPTLDEDDESAHPPAIRPQKRVHFKEPLVTSEIERECEGFTRKVSPYLARQFDTQHPEPGACSTGDGDFDDGEVQEVNLDDDDF